MLRFNNYKYGTAFIGLEMNIIFVKENLIMKMLFCVAKSNKPNVENFNCRISSATSAKATNLITSDPLCTEPKSCGMPIS